MRHFRASVSQFKLVHYRCSTQRIRLSCQHRPCTVRVFRDNIFPSNLVLSVLQRRFPSDSSRSRLAMTRRWSSACPGGSGWVCVSEVTSCVSRLSPQPMCLPLQANANALAMRTSASIRRWQQHRGQAYWYKTPLSAAAGDPTSSTTHTDAVDKITSK